MTWLIFFFAAKIEGSSPLLGRVPPLSIFTKMACSKCKALDARHRRLVPTEDELLVSGMVHQDLHHSMVADRVVKATKQIYCPRGADHLFLHRMPIGTVIAIPCFKMIVEDGDSDDSGSTTSEWWQSVRRVLLVRITSEAVYKKIATKDILHRDIEVLGSTTDFGLRVYCTHKSNCKTTQTLVKKGALV